MNLSLVLNFDACGPVNSKKCGLEEPFYNINLKNSSHTITYVGIHCIRN